MTPNRNSFSPSLRLRTRSNWSPRSASSGWLSGGTARPVSARHPAVDVVALRGHRAHGEQLVPDQEHLLEQRLGVPEVVHHDALLEPGDLLGHVPDGGVLTAGQRRDDRVGEVHRGRGPELALLDPAQRRPGLHQGALERHGRVDRPVHGDQEVPPDELVELEQVHVAHVARLRREQDEEQVVGVGVGARDVVALPAGPQGQLVEAEGAVQHVVRRVVVLRDVDPGEAVLARQQVGQPGELVLLGSGGRHEPHVHPVRVGAVDTVEGAAIGSGLHRRKDDHVTDSRHLIGLLLGTENDWPSVFEHLVRRHRAGRGRGRHRPHLRRRAHHGRAVRPALRAVVRPGDRPPRLLVLPPARVAEEGRADGRRVPAQLAVHVPGDGEARRLLRDDPARPQGARPRSWCRTRTRWTTRSTRSPPSGTTGRSTSTRWPRTSATRCS